MAKYKFTYFLNTACAERRPQTRRDLQEDWIVEEKEYPTALEAFEHAYIEILDNDEEALQDLYEENGIGPNDEVKKLEALKDDFECIDPGDGSTILISIEGEGPIDSYDSGFTKESFNDDYIEDDEDYDDEEYLDENKLINKTKKFESTDYSNTVPANVIRNIDDMLRNGSYPGVKWKISNVYSQLSIFDWWPEYISPTRLNQMRNFLQDAISIGCDKYCCFKVGASGCANGMWASDKATSDGYSPKGGKTLYRSFTPDYTYYDIDLGDGFTEQEFKSFRDVKNYIAEQEKLKSQDNENNIEDVNIDENKKLNETIDLKPDGGDKKNWFAFYTGLQGDSYSNNTQDNIAQFGKENLEGLKDLSIEEIKDSHIYWGSEHGFHGFYNGDTFILFDDIEKLPEDMKKDAYECCKGYKKIKKEDTQLEIDEKGLPVLEKPYSLSKRNDSRFQITSSHPYDETDYSYAISKTDDINGIWNVYDKDPNYVINSNKSAFMKIGVANDWNEALEFMKKLDSEKKPKIDRT